MIRSRTTGRYIKPPVQLPQLTWVIILAFILTIYAGLNIGWVLGAEKELHSPLASDYVTPSVSPSVSPTLTVTPSITKVPELPELAGKEQIIEYIKSKDWNDEEALKVAFCESGYNELAHGDRDLDPSSWGVFQIRSFNGRPPIEELLQYQKNIDYAYAMWKTQGGWQAWTCKKVL